MTLITKLKSVQARSTKWISKATDKERRDLVSMRTAFQKGKIRLPLAAVYRTIRETYPNICPHMETFSRWMKETN